MSYIEKLYNLESKVVVIFGGGGHICSKLAEGFIKSKCKVCLLDIRKKKLDLVKNQLSSKINSNIYCIKIDTTKKNEHKKALKLIKSKYGSVDVLVNGSGINSAIDFFEINEKDWDKVIKSQLNSTFLSCQVFGEDMIKNKKGSIINISSASSGPPLSKAYAYSASKSAIKNLTQNLAREFAKDNVRVNALRPGFFPTKWNLKNFIDKKRKKQIFDHTPMKRFG